jgi:glutaredoxin
MSWRWALAIVALAAALLVGCKRRPPPEGSGAAPVGSAKALPPLTLTDDTPDLFLTWVDAKGDAHTAEKIADVPLEGRDQVRVEVTTREEGTRDLFYVANLTNKNLDQTYPVVTLSRAAWDEMIAKRRQAARPDLAPAAQAAAPDAGSRAVIVYGASWCDACRQVMDFLKARHVLAVEKDIEADPAAEKEMRAKLVRAGLRGASSIPIVDVGGRILIGFDPQALDAALRGPHGAAL